MGIPRFYRWLSERYPLVNESLTADQVPEFDNFYLDMNGIIHNCSHNNTGGLCVKEEEDVFVEVFKYVVRLFHIARPRKLMYMAVDGVAPRAKMNQQRSRRFRAANDAREGREKAEEMGEEITGTPFDSNCITPGTEFMAKLTEHLRFFVQKRIQEDPLWQGVTVVLSGPDVPGEGEHKIMDYIRRSKAQPGYSPNLRHCLYGGDADLIMLALASHEPHFVLLREEVVFGKRATEMVENRTFIQKDKFMLFHISLMREYMDLEFSPPKNRPLPFTYSLERVIDDFVLFNVLVGNDFLPCLPLAEIGEGGLDDFFESYKEHLYAADSSNSPWLAGECGEIHFDQLALLLKKYATFEEKRLQAMVDDASFILGRRRCVGPQDAPDPPDKRDEVPPDPPDCNENARVQYYDVKFGMDVDTHAGLQEQRTLFHSYLEGLQWVMHYYYRGPDSASWSWYYPFYHSPMVADLVGYDALERPGIQIDIGEPFRPFQQLMAVLPGHSKSFLPTCYQYLFDSMDSPITHFYPAKFEVDVDGVKVPWGGVTLIPFIDTVKLLDAMALAERRGPNLTEKEKLRNGFGKARVIRFDRSYETAVSSTMPRRFEDLHKTNVRMQEFGHPRFPVGMAHFPNRLLDGCRTPALTFPAMAPEHRITSSTGSGVKVFQFEARGESIIIHLHPHGPMVPREETLRQLLQSPCSQVGYPMLRRGKIVAVHTANRKFLPDGKTEHNNQREHDNLTRQLMQDWRKRGVTLEFDAAAGGDVAAGIRKARASWEELWQQPVVEVRPVESAFLDAEGRLQYRFRGPSVFQLLHLVQKQEPPPPFTVPAAGVMRSLCDRFPQGAPVVCIGKEFQVFGQLGTVTRSDSHELEATFERALSRSAQDALQLKIEQIVQRQHTSLGWHELPAVAKAAKLELPLTRLILGSFMARTLDSVREDLGMNLMCEAKGDGTALCLPCYSMKSSSSWFFSDLAIEALQDYRDKFPGLFDALRKRSKGGRTKEGERDFEMRLAFPDHPDQDYASKKLVKYCNQSPWKRLRLATGMYMALTPKAIREVQEAVERAYRVSDRVKEQVRNPRCLYRAEDMGSCVPAELFPGPGESLAVGQRGVFIKAQGLVPVGTKGTVIGIYGAGQSGQQDMELELLLDEDSFGASDLRGRAPSMRGLQVAASAFLPLLPRLGTVTATDPVVESCPSTADHAKDHTDVPTTGLSYYGGSGAGRSNPPPPLAATSAAFSFLQPESELDAVAATAEPTQSKSEASTMLLNMIKQPSPDASGPDDPDRTKLSADADIFVPADSTSYEAKRSVATDRIQEKLNAKLGGASAWLSGTSASAPSAAASERPAGRGDRKRNKANKATAAGPAPSAEDALPLPALGPDADITSSRSSLPPPPPPPFRHPPPRGGSGRAEAEAAAEILSALGHASGSGSPPPRKGRGSGAGAGSRPPVAPQASGRAGGSAGDRASGGAKDGGRERAASGSKPDWSKAFGDLLSLGNPRSAGGK